MGKPAWKKFEEDVQSYFEGRMENEPIVYHRFYDTHSAGSLLPSQPSDHLVKTTQHSILIETKHSEVHASLRSCFSGMVDNNQIAHMRIWMRANSIALIVFEGTKGIEVWEAGHCARCRLEGKRLDPERMLKFGSSLQDVFEPLWLTFPGTEMKWRLL